MGVNNLRVRQAEYDIQVCIFILLMELIIVLIDELKIVKMCPPLYLAYL